MEPSLITLTEAAFMLSMCTVSAAKFLASHGITPVNVGLGKTRRLRYDYFEVKRLVNTIIAEQSKPSLKQTLRKTNRNKQQDFFSTPIKDILSEFSQKMQ